MADREPEADSISVVRKLLERTRSGAVHWDYARDSPPLYVSRLPQRLHATLVRFQKDGYEIIGGQTRRTGPGVLLSIREADDAGEPRGAPLILLHEGRADDATATLLQDLFTVVSTSPGEPASVRRVLAALGG